MTAFRRITLLLVTLLLLAPIGILAGDAFSFWDILYFFNFVLFGLSLQAAMIVAIVVGFLYFFRPRT